jgi:hypothetical protein
MTTAKPSKQPTVNRAGLWSTITTAISGGWGTTARMIVILVVLGVIAIGVISALGDVPAGSMIRALLTLLGS